MMKTQAAFWLPEFVFEVIVPATTGLDTNLIHYTGFAPGQNS
jgi:hypothetical protein